MLLAPLVHHYLACKRCCSKTQLHVFQLVPKKEEDHFIGSLFRFLLFFNLSLNVFMVSLTELLRPYASLRDPLVHLCRCPVKRGSGKQEVKMWNQPWGFFVCLFVIFPVFY